MIHLVRLTGAAVHSRRSPFVSCCQVHSDFVIAATRGAVAVVDGNIMPINPGEEGK